MSYFLLEKLLADIQPDKILFIYQKRLPIPPDPNERHVKSLQQELSFNMITDAMEL